MQCGFLPELPLDAVLTIVAIAVAGRPICPQTVFARFIFSASIAFAPFAMTVFGTEHCTDTDKDHENRPQRIPSDKVDNLGILEKIEHTDKYNNESKTH